MSYLIHQLLENSADTFPEKEAVVHGKHRFAYLNIEKGANRIAHWLMEKQRRYISRKRSRCSWKASVCLPGY